MRRFLSALMLLVALAGCDGRAGRADSPGALGAGESQSGPGPEDLAPGSPPSALSDELDRAREELRAADPEEIRRAALDYVRSRTEVRDVTIQIEAAADGWARVRVIPAGDLTDPAVLYLREAAGGWEGVAIGTAFSPEDLDRLGVPATVRPDP